VSRSTLYRDTHPLWGAAYKVAVARYSWLCEIVEMDDLRQTISLACLDYDFGPGNVRNAVDRAMYRLAREHGFVRPSAGLERGHTGKWKKAETEYFRRSRAKAIT
jgi:hypothetical protein